MTVREAITSIVGLTGATSICGCRTGDNSIVLSALAALNRATQQLWASPNARAMTLESISVTLANLAPIDLPTNVLNVVGPVQWGGYNRIPLLATESAFRNFFLDYADQHFDEPLWDDINFLDFHDVSNGGTWYSTEFLLPLADDRRILIYFDNAANINTLNQESPTTPGGQAVNTRTIFVRVEIPHVDTDIADLLPLIVSAVRRKAGQFLEIEQINGNKVRLYRRRYADVAEWTMVNPGPLNQSVIRGPRFPVCAWAEELKASSGNDLARVRLHLLPAVNGAVAVKATREPPKFTMDDLDCDGDGVNSTEISLMHQWAESLLLPLARLAFAQDCVAWLTPQTVAAVPALESAAQSARETLGLAAPSASQHLQANQTTTHAHP